MFGEPETVLRRFGLCLVLICPGRRAINLSTIFRGGYWLRHINIVFTLSTGIVQFLLRGLGSNPGYIRTDTVRILYGNCAMSVRLPSSLRSLRTEIVRSPCGDRPSHGARTGIVQCHLRHVYGLRSYDFSKFVKFLPKPNRRGRGARESVRKSHSRLLPPQGGLAEAARKGGYGQDMGSLDPLLSQMWTRH